MENGYGMIFKSEFKNFKKRSEKMLVKSLSIPIFYANMWDCHNVNVKHRTKVVQHLSYATTIPDIEMTDRMIIPNDTKVIDTIVLDIPFCVALVGNIGNDTCRQRLLDQHIFKQKKDSYRVPYFRVCK